jgi:DNA polymerase-4
LLSDSTCAIAASYEAKLKGIKTGTKIYEAKKLCPELICIPCRHKLYVEYHTRIFAEVNKLLCIDYVCSIDEGAGRLTGKYQQEEEATLLAQAIKQNVGDYITCSIGIAPSKYLAKIAAEMKKPDGLSIIKPEDIPTKLFDLSLRDITGIGHRMLKRLYLANIDTVEKLYGCSSGHLQTIWGSIYGKKCWYLLRGYELSEYAVKNRVIGHSRILAPEIRNVNAARDVATELVMKAAKRLRDKALYSTCINLYIRTTNRVVYKSSAKISPACDNATILKQLLNIWDRLSEQNKINNIHQVAVSLAGLIEKPRQLTFDEIGIITKKHGVSVAMDNINNKYGKSVINLGIRSAVKEDPIAFAHIPGVS